MFRVIGIICILSGICIADFMELKDGLSAKIEILDTIGCNVKIRRNGNVVEIKKSLISYVVYKTDTISYEKFDCTPDIANQKSGLVFEEGYSRDKVNTILSKMKKHLSSIKNKKLYYNKELINGNQFEDCWEQGYMDFGDELKNKYAAEEIDNEFLYKLLTSKSDTSCVLIPFFARFGYVDYKQIIGDIDRKDFMFNSPGAFVKCVVNIKIVDLRSHEIIYDDTSEYRETIQEFSTDSSEKEDLSQAKYRALKNALLNSMDKRREIFSKLIEFGEGNNTQMPIQFVK